MSEQSTPPEEILPEKQINNRGFELAKKSSAKERDVNPDLDTENFQSEFPISELAQLASTDLGGRLLLSENIEDRSNCLGTALFLGDISEKDVHTDSLEMQQSIQENLVPVKPDEKGEIVVQENDIFTFRDQFFPQQIIHAGTVVDGSSEIVAHRFGSKGELMGNRLADVKDHYENMARQRGWIQADGHLTVEFFRKANKL